ncbi:interferon-induced protein with tetratricopeptide repeats 3 [Perognathus longimembris pacificus]|uniref:interferon-induced protein with tetratricopeptide repeats 3 n=1 Tax=Perognathus longimembris pacificus TaxID=214514 RepID=UPI002018BC40|nr:interferon-induced protein with tetratricopeptide repeats 3 [Perognathus longimembris pacificus]
MSEAPKKSLEKILQQLKCHFTWNLFKDGNIPSYLEERLHSHAEHLDTEYKATIYNFLAYIKHLNGENEAALECLQKAEELHQQGHTDQAEIRSLVTWGNYAWLYYHMGQLSEVQTYIDKVKRICEQFSNPYSIEYPEIDSEEGWTRLKCGKHERAKVCFQKALEEQPNNPEFSSGLAIAMFHLNDNPQKESSAEALKQAIELDPDNLYVKALMALKLQKTSAEAKGEQFIEEALRKDPCPTNVLLKAVTFYRKKGDLDKVIELIVRTIECTPNNSCLCYHILCSFMSQIKKMKVNGESKAGGNQEKIEQLEKLLRDCTKKALEKRVRTLNTCFELNEFLETEECCQNTFNKELPKAESQHLHSRDCSIQENHGKAEDTAVQNGFESISISKDKPEKEERKSQVQNMEKNLLQPDAVSSWYLQGSVHKRNGDLLQALACYEKELGYLLRESPSGIGSFFLTASQPGDSNEDKAQGAGASQLLDSFTKEEGNCSE